LHWDDDDDDDKNNHDEDGVYDDNFRE